MTPIELEKGPRVSLAGEKLIYFGWIALMGLIVGVLILFLSAVFILQGQKTFRYIGGYFLGVVVVGLFGAWLPFLCQALFRGERYVIGRRALQRVTASGAIVHHIPYDNIDEVGIEVQHIGENGKPLEVVVITLCNGRCQDTIHGMVTGDSYQISEYINLSPFNFRRKLTNRIGRWSEEKDDPLAQQTRAVVGKDNPTSPPGLPG